VHHFVGAKEGHLVVTNFLALLEPFLVNFLDEARVIPEALSVNSSGLKLPGIVILAELNNFEVEEQVSEERKLLHHKKPACGHNLGCGRITHLAFLCLLDLSYTVTSQLSQYKKGGVEKLTPPLNIVGD